MPSRWPGRLLVFLALWLAVAAWADVPVPTLKARVTDLTQTLSASQRTALENDLQALEARSGSQLAVLMVPTTQPETIEQFSMRVVENWKLGRKGKDDGLLLLVAKNDRKVRIEVGYGLEGDIPDAVAKRVIAETITPLFKQGDFAGGIKAGVQRLAGLIEGQGKTERPPEECPAACAPTGFPKPSSGWNVTDLTGTLSDEQARTLNKELADFYDSGRTKPAFIVMVPTVKPEPIAQYAARILKTWGDEDNLDVDRSILLLVAKDERTAHIEAGAGLGQRILPGAAEALVAEVIEPQLRRGEFAGAIQSGVHGLEKMIDDAIGNKTFEERLTENVSELPVWLLIALVAVGTGLRWLLGPLFGALVMGGAVGVGAWFVSGLIEIALAAGVIAFIFVLVGLANWIGMVLDGAFGGGGGRSGGSGGFGGGGGGFGGGGASGSW